MCLATFACDDVLPIILCWTYPDDDFPEKEDEDNRPRMFKGVPINL